MLYTWNWHKTVNQLYFNNKNKDFKKYLACSKFPINGSYYGIDDPNLLLLLLLSHLSRVWLCATPWTAAYQAPPSLGLSRQEYWSGLPLPSPRSQFESIWYYCIILSHDRYRFSRWALGFWQRRTRVLRASEKCLFPQKGGTRRPDSRRPGFCVLGSGPRGWDPLLLSFVVGTHPRYPWGI